MTDNVDQQARTLYDAVQADYPNPMPWNLERLGFLIVHGQETPEDDLCVRCGERRPVIGRTCCENCLQRAELRRRAELEPTDGPPDLHLVATTPRVQGR